MPTAWRGYYHDHLIHWSADIDVFDHRAANDDLHRAAYQHVYVHNDGGPDDDHLNYHYPAPWPYDYKHGGADINDDDYLDGDHDIEYDFEHDPANVIHDDHLDYGAYDVHHGRAHYYDDGCPDNHRGLNDNHDDAHHVEHHDGAIVVVLNDDDFADAVKYLAPLIDHYHEHGPGEHDYGPQFNDDDDVPPGRFDLNDDDFHDLPILDLDKFDGARHDYDDEHPYEHDFNDAP